MPGGDDASTVDGASESALAGIQDAVEREAQVRSPRDGLPFVRRIVQPVEDFERVSRPDGAVASNVLHVKARIAIGGPVPPKIAVSRA